MNYNIIKNKIITLLNLGLGKEEQIRLDKQPKELLNELDISIANEGNSQEELAAIIDKIVRNSVNTNHPFFMNQMYGKQNPISIYGDVLTTLLNTSMYTYEVAPMLTLIEKECISKLGNYIWGNTKNDGVFTPGGSISNMKGIMLARNNKLKNVKTKGLHTAPEFSIFISDQAHYSFLKGAVFMGFGEDSIVKVSTNSKGQIDINSLLVLIELEKQKGRIPLMLVGVAGTTFSGVYDDLDSLAEIAAEHNMWYHVDAVYGGSLMFSRNETHKFKGIEQADSVSWNLHKIMGVPLTCAAFLTKKQGLLNEAFSVDADYLFHDDEEDLNLGQKSIQCGRRVDALKLWLAWKHDGEEGFENRINKLMKSTFIFSEKIKNLSEFELLCQPESPIVIMRIVSDDLCEEEENILNKKVREYLFKDGKIIFNYSSYKGKIYLRFVISDSELKEEQIDVIIKNIQKTILTIRQQEKPSLIVKNAS